MLDLIGEADRHLRQVESLFPEVRFVARGDEIVITGDEDPVDQAKTMLDELLILVQEGHPLDERRIIEVA